MRASLTGIGMERFSMHAVWGLLAAAFFGLCLGSLVTSHGIWAEARPLHQGIAGALLFATGTMLAARLLPWSSAQPDVKSGIVMPRELAATAERLLAEEKPAALFLCEITGLGRTNLGDGTAGAAEHILAEAERRLSRLLPAGARATRWVEQRFLVCLPFEGDQLSLLVWARDVMANLGSGAAGSTRAPEFACRIGVAIAPADGRWFSELLANAELALGQARLHEKPGYCLFSPEFAAEARRRTGLQRAVRDAVLGDALRLEFQPVFDMRSGALSGFEALIRLQDAELGPIPPSEFIPVAEQSGAILDMGQWAVEEACRVAAQWPGHLVVAVNLSPAELLSGTIVASVRRALERHALPAYRLEVEITEGTLMTESELVLGQLRMLRDMGVGIALDDFGTGYSSLGYLCRFPFSKLKIDRSFAAALDHSASARNVLRAIVRLGHGLGMTVTAEGIENTRQLNLLRDIGCDLAQGYLLGRPAPLSDLAAIILRNFAKCLERRPRSGKRTAA